MSAELTPDRIAWLEGRMSSGNHTEYMADTVLALITYWREHEALAKESEAMPKVCRHCGHVFGHHAAFGDWCPDRYGKQSFEPADPQPETVPKLCRHCGHSLSGHRTIGNNCPTGLRDVRDGEKTICGYTIWSEKVFEPGPQ